MSFSDRVTMAFLEEDNTQRAFFRLRPLLNSAGPCTQEDLSIMPDEGFLRIVPDKNEQANFKDRMRSLGHLCMIDLTPYSPDANKIRTNKNYASDKEEKNQYILYSDVIHPLPENLAYEVLEAEAEKELQGKSSLLITPLGYIRVNGQWYGPLGQGGDALPCPPLPEKCLHGVDMPDGKRRVFYWPEETAGEQAVSALQDIPEDAVAVESRQPNLPELRLAASEATPLLSAAYSRPMDYHSQVRAAVPEEPSLLSGTPLYSGIMPKSRMARPRNPLHEVVDAQWRAAKYEAPSAQLHQGANLRHVENPLERFRQAAENVWAIPEAQQQALDTLLALPGLQKRLEHLMQAEEPNSLLTASMRRQLQELEAERLSLLIQLDRAKENKAALREEALAFAQQEQSAKLKQMQEQVLSLKEEENVLKAQLHSLAEEKKALETLCDELAGEELSSRLLALAKGFRLPLGKPITPLRISPLPGTITSPESMISALQAAFSKEWGTLSQDDAVHFLLLFAMCPKIQLAHASLAEALRFIQLCMASLGISAAFGVQAGPDQPVFAHSPNSAMSPVSMATPYGEQEDPSPSLKTFLLARKPEEYVGNLHFDISPWPVIALPAAAFENASAVHTSEVLPAISAASLEAFTGHAALPNQESHQWLKELDAAMASACHPIPRVVLNAMQAYMDVAGKWMQGGIAAAADYAFLAWIAPQLLHQDKLRQAVKALLPSLPRSSALLG